MPEENTNQREERLRDPEVVSRRCLALHAIIAAGHGQPRDKIIGWLQGEGLSEALSPKEIAFLQAENSAPQQCINATWRAEALAPLLWALGRLPPLPPPTALCDLPALLGVMPPLGGPTTGWLVAPHLRAEAEILAANEAIYQLHWSVRDARLFGRPTPAELHPGVIRERHYALNWLIGYNGQDWDDITTDT